MVKCKKNLYKTRPNLDSILIFGEGYEYQVVGDYVMSNGHDIWMVQSLVEKHMVTDFDMNDEADRDSGFYRFEDYFVTKKEIREEKLEKLLDEN